MLTAMHLCGMANTWLGSGINTLLVSAQVKKGPLAETSPMLNDISGVPNWGKVGLPFASLQHSFCVVACAGRTNACLSGQQCTALWGS